MLPDKYRRVPAALKPQQGGQQYFHHFQLLEADATAREGVQSQSQSSSETIPLRLPQSNIAASRDPLLAALEKEIASQEVEAAHTTQRVFNERQWFEEQTMSSEEASSPSLPDGTMLPERIVDNAYFRSRYGYSLVKETKLPAVEEYSNLDLWGEMPKYTRDMYFLYLVSRRRNTYAVCFDFDGKRLLTAYTVGNRGLKGGDKGFRGDGSVDNGHQVTSMYLNDVIPIIREQRASEGRPLAKDDKVDLVVRVLGFYNGRQGAVRAVTDRSDFFTVRYFEDVTPFPLNGPRMPRGVFK